MTVAWGKIDWGEVFPRNEELFIAIQLVSPELEG